MLCLKARKLDHFKIRAIAHEFSSSGFERAELLVFHHLMVSGCIPARYLAAESLKGGKGYGTVESRVRLLDQ